MKIEIRGVEYLDRFLRLLENIESWLWTKGIRQWEPGSHRKQYVNLKKMVLNGWIILAEENTEAVGGCIMTFVTPDIWKDHKTHAVYLSSLVVAREYAGSGLSRQIVQYSIMVAKKFEACELRLNCWEGNIFLKKFYTDCSFLQLPPQPEGDYLVRQFKIST